MNQKSDLVMDNANKGLYSHRSVKTTKRHLAKSYGLQPHLK